MKVRCSNEGKNVVQLVDDIIDYCTWRRQSHKDLVKKMVQSDISKIS